MRLLVAQGGEGRMQARLPLVAQTPAAVSAVESFRGRRLPPGKDADLPPCPSNEAQALHLVCPTDAVGEVHVRCLFTEY